MPTASTNCQRISIKCSHASRSRRGEPRTQPRAGRYKTPAGPYGWLSSPPAVQRYLGMLWLGQLLYPEYTQYDLQTEVTEYYKLFYGCNLTDEMYQDLIADSY